MRIKDILYHYINNREIYNTIIRVYLQYNNIIQEAIFILSIRQSFRHNKFQIAFPLFSEIC